MDVGIPARALNLSLSHFPALPIPTLSTMVEIKDICAKFNRATNPNELGYTYEQLKSLDDIHVSLIPEKKGTLLKHNEYLVESRVSGCG